MEGGGGELSDIGDIYREILILRFNLDPPTCFETSRLIWILPFDLDPPIWILHFDRSNEIRFDRFSYLIWILAFDLSSDMYRGHQTRGRVI